MVTSLTEFFSAGVLAPHAICLLWRKDLIALHGSSDLLIALSYFAIPILILKATRLRPDLIDRRVAILFSMFIVACGISHLAGILTLWYPYYGWQALIKLITAAISVVTAFQLWKLWPDLIAMPSSEQLAHAKAENIAHEKNVMAIEQSNAKLQEFAYMAAHDLRAPLNTLSVILDLMDHDIEIPKSELEENVDDMSSQVKRMQVLIDDLLSYAKIGVGENDIELVDTERVISGVLKLISVPDEIDIEYENTVAQVKLVRTEFELILRNLITNAIVHHDKSSGKVQIRLIDDNKEKIVFEVEDDGPGISDEHREKIFKMFYRIKGSKEKSGSGMGLAAVSRAVEAARGTIEVLTGKNGRGALFRVSLPLTEPQ